MRKKTGSVGRKKEVEKTRHSQKNLLFVFCRIERHTDLVNRLIFTRIYQHFVIVDSLQIIDRIDILQRRNRVANCEDFLVQIIIGNKSQFDFGIIENELVFLLSNRWVNRNIYCPNLQESQINEIPLRAIG